MDAVRSHFPFPETDTPSDVKRCCGSLDIVPEFRQSVAGVEDELCTFRLAHLSLPLKNSASLKRLGCPSPNGLIFRNSSCNSSGSKPKSGHAGASLGNAVSRSNRSSRVSRPACHSSYAAGRKVVSGGIARIGCASSMIRSSVVPDRGTPTITGIAACRIVRSFVMPLGLAAAQPLQFRSEPPDLGH